MLRRFASNALANLATGVSGTLFQVGLTAIASRSFDRNDFAAWSLAVSLAALVPLFSVSLSTVMTRRLVELPPAMHRFVHTATSQIARTLALTAVVVIVALAIGLHQVSAPARSVSAAVFGAMVLVLVLSQIWQVVRQPTFGWFYAREENWKVARLIVATRAGALAGAALLCLRVPGNPLLAAVCTAVGAGAGSFAGGRVVLAASHAVDADPGPAPSDRGRAAVAEHRAAMVPLLRAFAVWSIGSAVIQYTLPAFVSIIAPATFNAFVLAYTLNLVLVGTVGTAASALLAPLARKRLSGDLPYLERWLAWAPLATGAALIALLGALWLVLPRLLAVWSPGVAAADAVRLPLFWLSMQTIARSMALIHSVLLSSVGDPRQLRRPILLELGLTALVAVPLGAWLGELAFLAALAAAGFVTAAFTAATTLRLGVCSPQARGRLLLTFITTQTATLVLWSLLTH